MNKIKSMAEWSKIMKKEEAETKKEIKRRNIDRNDEDRVIALFGIWEVQSDGTLCRGNYNNAKQGICPMWIGGDKLAKYNWLMFPPLAMKDNIEDFTQAYFYALNHLGVKSMEVNAPLPPL